jgi:hypothetical protein
MKAERQAKKLMAENNISRQQRQHGGETAMAKNVSENESQKASKKRRSKRRRNGISGSVNGESVSLANYLACKISGNWHHGNISGVSAIIIMALITLQRRQHAGAQNNNGNISINISQA